MTYAELFAAVAQRLGPDKTFAIEVQTFRHVYDDGEHELDTEWCIAVIRGKDDVERYPGPTALIALSALSAEVEPDPEPALADVSDAVGDAEVSK